MIGQVKVLSRIEQIPKEHFPKLYILVGEKGMGKKLIAEKIAEKLSIQTVKIQKPKVAEIREIIELAYTLQTPTLYILADMDATSIQAKNSLLKITEEPPENAFFVMTFESDYNILDTLKSRAQVTKLDNYTATELITYAKSKNYTIENEEAFVNICNTMLDIDNYYSSNHNQFLDFARLVIDNIMTVSDANAFKISEKLKLKSEGGGYDIKLFLQAMLYLMYKKLKYNQSKGYLEGIHITNKYLSELKIVGINKRVVIDNWIMEMRESYKK